MSLLYRTTKQCVDWLPSQVLRFRPFGVYEISLAERTGNANLPAALDESLRIEWVTCRDRLKELVDVAAHENLHSWDGTTRSVAVAWLDEVPIGAAWIATESFAETDLGLRISLQPNEAWLFAAVVKPTHRRQGIYSRLLHFVVSELANENFRRLLLGISTGNRASLAAHSQFGAEQIGSIFAAKCFGFGFCRVTGGVMRDSRSVVQVRQRP